MIASNAAIAARILCALCFAALPVHAHHRAEPAPLTDYTAPAPGTYVLHRIMPAPDGRVIDVRGRLGRLADFTHGKVTLLGFIYTTCTDPEGCPLAYEVFDALKARVHSMPALHGKVRFVTLSFDPARDLMPLVEGFGQDVRYALDRSSGKPVRELSHVLKVFLIDRAGDVREIYTSTFLHPQVVMADIETLLRE